MLVLKAWRGVLVVVVGKSVGLFGLFLLSECMSSLD